MLASLILASGCGGSSGGGVTPPQNFDEACALVPDCAQPRYSDAEAKQGIYRVMVERDASGSIRIVSVDQAEVFAGDGVPLSNVGASHLLVGMDANGDQVDAQGLRFASALGLESLDDFKRVEIDLSDQSVNTVAYLEANEAIETLGVVDVDGNLLTVENLPQQARRKRAHTLKSDAQPAGHCAHVRILEGEADRFHAQNMAFYDDTVLLTPTPTQRAVIVAALNRMTPLMCHAVSRIAVGTVKNRGELNGAVAQIGGGDFMLINAGNLHYTENNLASFESVRVAMMRTILHEAGHALEALLNANSANPGDYGGHWTAANRSVASQTLDNVRLNVGLRDEWRRTHRAFASEDFAKLWANDGGPAREVVQEFSAVETAEAGFMSRYGGTGYTDDIAEMISWVYAAELYEKAGIPEGRREKEDYACQLMRQHTETSVPGRLAAVYTKVMFLHDLGALHSEDVARCLGPHIGLATSNDGMHVHQGGSHQSSFEDQVEAVIGNTSSGELVFEMSAHGEANFGDNRYPALFRLQLDLLNQASQHEASYRANPPWPRGLYPLTSSSLNVLELRLDGEPAGDFDSTEGFVLVAEASNQRISGSIFLTKVWRPHAPVPVPEVYDPPLIIRFQISN